MSETFGRYTVIKQLGRGAMGIVYLASDPMLNRQVAVKTVDLAVQEPEEREFLRDRLFRDARAAAVLKHPNIVAIYDVFEDAGRAYVVMEYIEGDSLAARLKSHPLPDIAAVLKVIRQMADALDYTHSRGVIHRDIKPANVMIDTTGTTKIMDFGIARITDARTCTPTGMVMGTVEYMAPEQILGEEVDGRADQFALAVVAYQMLTGSTLFGPNTVATLTYKIVNEAAPLPRTRNASLPPGVDAVIAKALSKKPADRFAKCSDLAESLAQAFSDAPTAPIAAPVAPTAPVPVPTAVAMPPSAVAPVATRSSSTPLVLAALAVVLLGGTLAAVILKPWNLLKKPDISTAAVVSAPAAAPVEPLQASGPDALKPAPGAAPAVQPPVVSTPAPQPAQTAPAVPQTTPKTDIPARPEPVTPAPVQPQPEPPPSAPAATAAEPMADDFAVAPPEPKLKTGNTPYQQALQMGQQQVRSKDYVGALRSFGNAVSLRPRSAQAHYDRGVVFEHFQQFDAAIRDFSDAVRMEPNLVMAHTQLAACLEQQHHDPEALVEFQRALELNPNAPLALFGRGNIYLRRRQFALAVADYNRLLEINPRYAPAYQNRAIARLATGDFAGAAADRRAEQSLRK
jgi:serine/threonine-protein kinase